MATLDDWEDLSLGTTTGNDLTIVGFPTWAYTGWTERTIGLTPSIGLKAGTQYAIVVRALLAGSDDAYMYGAHPGTYDGGEVHKSVDSGVTWEILVSGVNNDEFDASFNTGVDSYLPTPDPGNPFDGIITATGSVWKAHVFTASSDYTLSSVTLLLAKNYQGTPGTVTVSIRGDTSNIPIPTYTDFPRPLGYNANKVWQPGTGWVDINTFTYTGGGSFKSRVLVVGHKVVYFGDI